MNEFARMFVPGALVVPESLCISDGSTLCAAPQFSGPPTVRCDSYCTPIENQGAKPWCAAYSATSYAESILWKRNGYHRDIDPEPIYRMAKTIDGDPNGNGTTIDAVLEALVRKGIFGESFGGRIRTFGGLRYGCQDGADTLKYAIHRYGACIVGFDIDGSWYGADDGVIRGGGASNGGHAVVCCGYTPDGFIICNSWGARWGNEGKAFIPNAVFDRQFLYGGILTNTLDNLG